MDYLLDPAWELFQMWERHHIMCHGMAIQEAELFFCYWWLVCIIIKCFSGNFPVLTRSLSPYHPLPQITLSTPLEPWIILSFSLSFSYLAPGTHILVKHSSTRKRKQEGIQRGYV